MGKINEIKDMFGGMSADEPVKVTLNLNGEEKELSLDMTVDDLHPMMAMGNDGEMTEEQAKKMTSVLRRILYRSYLPHWDDARDQEPDSLSNAQEEENEEAKGYLEKLLMQKMPYIFAGIAESLGWQEEGQSMQHPTMSREDFPSSPQE